MAFFCPGSGVKIKKEFDNNARRPYDSQGTQQYYPSHRHHSSGYQSPRVNVRHNSVAERLQDNVPQPPISTQFFQKVVVLHDHYPERDMELSVRKGEKLEVVKREPAWLFVRNERGKEGYVPAQNCIAPVTRRTRSNSRSSASTFRPVMSGEIVEQTGGHSRSRGNVPMYSSSSAGRVHRHGSPMNTDDFDRTPFQRLGSPSSVATTPIEPSHTNGRHHDNKGSLTSSSGVSLMDSSLPTLTRAFSQDEINTPTGNDSSMFSMSQSAIEPNMGGTKILLDPLKVSVSHKYSSSEDSGTVDSTHCRDVDYASTIRNGETSSDEKIKLERVSSRGATPSIQDRPLPSPPNNSHNVSPSKDESPPPVPPRVTSLETSRQRRPRSNRPRPPPPTNDDTNPYAQPMDSIINPKPLNNNKPRSVQSDVPKTIVNVVDISGVDSPYSEVYRPQRRPINVQDGRDSPMSSRRGHVSNPVMRMPSPYVNGADNFPLLADEGGSLRDGMNSVRSGQKSMRKFRKNMWGVFICMQDFDGLDENEVSVRMGEQVMVMNQDDQFWYWVVKHKTDNTEGFVPSKILREVGDKMSMPAIENQQPNVLRHVETAPHLDTPTNHHPDRLMGHTLHGTNIRPRVKSVGGIGLGTHRTSGYNNSIEKIPFDNEEPKVSILTPSSPPPPYAEQDPVLYPSSSIPQDRSMPRATSRSRPPTYPIPRQRSSTTHMYPVSSPLFSGHVSQSASRLNHTHCDRFYNDHQNSYNNPVPQATGGTLV